MPWCDPCGRYLTPNAVDVDGSCPSCGQEVEPGSGVDRSHEKVPWHFWVVVVLAGAYLVWRAVEGVALLF